MAQMLDLCACFLYPCRDIIMLYKHVYAAPVIDICSHAGCRAEGHGKPVLPLLSEATCHATTQLGRHR